MAGMAPAFDNSTYEMTTFRRYDRHGNYIHPHWDQYKDVIDDAPQGFMVLLGAFFLLILIFGVFGIYFRYLVVSLSMKIDFSSPKKVALN